MGGNEMSLEILPFHFFWNCCSIPCSVPPSPWRKAPVHLVVTLFPMSKNSPFWTFPLPRSPGPSWPNQSLLEDGLTSCLLKKIQVLWPGFSWSPQFPSLYLFSSSDYFVCSKIGASTSKPVSILPHAQPASLPRNPWLTHVPSGIVGLSPSFWHLE